MTNLTIKYLVQHFFRVFGKPLEMSLEEFNNLLAVAQDELYKEFLFGYASGNGAEVDARTEQALLPFRNDQSIVGTNSTTMGFTVFQYEIHPEAHHVINAFIASEATQTVIPIDLVTSNEFVERHGNPITKPSTSYPVGYFQKVPGHFYLYVLPLQSTRPVVTVSYYKAPTTPSLVITTANGVESQNASSVALEFDSIFHVDIVRKILQYLGLSVGNQLIIEAVENQNLKEK
jgi:hypothetical protein